MVVGGKRIRIFLCSSLPLFLRASWRQDQPPPPTSPKKYQTVATPKTFTLMWETACLSWRTLQVLFFSPSVFLSFPPNSCISCTQCWQYCHCGISFSARERRRRRPGRKLWCAQGVPTTDRSCPILSIVNVRGSSFPETSCVASFPFWCGFFYFFFSQICYHITGREKEEEEELLLLLPADSFRLVDFDCLP